MDIILSGNKAENFIVDMERADEKEAQLRMAKAMGHFKHENEKRSKEFEICK